MMISPDPRLTSQSLHILETDFADRLTFLCAPVEDVFVPGVVAVMIIVVLVLNPVVVVVLVPNLVVSAVVRKFVWLVAIGREANPSA
jgi:hypothetical protein